MKRMKKGQAVFEFIIASLILFSIVFYTVSFMSTDFELRHERLDSDILESGALRISDILLTGNPQSITGEWPVLSREKMESLNNTCQTADYNEIMENFSLKELAPYVKYTNINITVTDEDGRNYVSCGRTPHERTESASVTRFAVIQRPGQDKLARVKVVLWT